MVYYTIYNKVNMVYNSPLQATKKRRLPVFLFCLAYHRLNTLWALIDNRGGVFIVWLVFIIDCVVIIVVVFVFVFIFVFFYFVFVVVVVIFVVVVVVIFVVVVVAVVVVLDDVTGVTGGRNGSEWKGHLHGTDLGAKGGVGPNAHAPVAVEKGLGAAGQVAVGGRVGVRGFREGAATRWQIDVRTGALRQRGCFGCK